MLRAVDNRWVRHLTDLDELREGIGLRAFGQQDPLVAYKKEAYEMYAGAGRVHVAGYRPQHLPRPVCHAGPRCRSACRPIAGMAARRNPSAAPRRSVGTIRVSAAPARSTRTATCAPIRAASPRPRRQAARRRPSRQPGTAGRQRQRRAGQARIRHAIGRRQTARQGQDGTQVERASMRKSDIAQARALLPGQARSAARQADLTHAVRRRARHALHLGGRRQQSGQVGPAALADRRDHAGALPGRRSGQLPARSTSTSTRCST